MDKGEINNHTNMDVMSDESNYCGGQNDLELTDHSRQSFGRSRQEAEEKSKLLQRKEQVAVSYLRVAVYCSVVVTAAVVSLGVYFHIQQEEQDTFRIVFESNANKLAESFLHSVDRKITAIGGLASDITQYAISNRMAFPNVTIDSNAWVMMSGQARVQADTINVEYAPLVTDETRAGWEEYAFHHKDWQPEAFVMDKSYRDNQDNHFGLEERQTEHAPGTNDGDDEAQGPPKRSLQEGGGGETEGKEAEEEDSRYSRSIFELGPPPKKGPPPSIPLPEGSGPYAPLWQISPVLPHEFVLNMDLSTRAVTGVGVKEVTKSNHASLGPAQGVRDPDNITLPELVPIRITNSYIQRGQYRHDQGFYFGDPTTALTYPVFDSFDPRNQTLAGFLQSPLLWRLNFEGVVPEGIGGGFVAVIKSSLNSDPFSYLIEGPTVTYLGFQDFHSSKYDDMFEFRNMGETLKVNRSPKNQVYNSVEVDFGDYVLYIYPTQELQDQYVTNEPAVYAAITASIFVFTLLVLATFDVLVARRQHVVMKKAVQSRALIATMYPEQVRERLFEDEDTPKNKTTKWRTSVSTEPTSEAIATLYPESTILLMDLAGFTKWSSSRSPADVFALLESLYQSFDRLAVKRGVYKIETIGDCWVGVTGVPTPQDDHAPRMARFAGDCLVKMEDLISEKLADQLGEDTRDLRLRVGIHSGPITGGVLRGTKGRFQLFGDTINTASRMESNGIPGKIQVSETTANELMRHGHENWLVEREDKIEAKGKGFMTTFWVSNGRNRSCLSSTERSSATERLRIKDEFF